MAETQVPLRGWVVRDVSTKISTAAAPSCPARMKPPGGPKDLKAKFTESKDPISHWQTDARTSDEVVHGKEACPNVWRVSLPSTPPPAALTAGSGVSSPGG